MVEVAKTVLEFLIVFLIVYFVPISSVLRRKTTFVIFCKCLIIK